MGNEAVCRSILCKAYVDLILESAAHPTSVRGNNLLPVITATTLHASVLLENVLAPCESTTKYFCPNHPDRGPRKCDSRVSLGALPCTPYLGWRTRVPYTSVHGVRPWCLMCRSYVSFFHLFVWRFFSPTLVKRLVKNSLSFWRPDV